MSNVITPTQIRAALAMLSWEHKHLAEEAGLSEVSISNIKNGTTQAQQSSMDRIKRAFERNGLEFIDSDGVRRRPKDIEIFDGVERFEDFHRYLYNYLETFGGDLCISVTNEQMLAGSKRDVDAHRTKMQSLVATGKVTARVLMSAGATHSTWASIRRQPYVQGMPQISFFTFGDNLALISFDKMSSTHVVLHKATPFATAYKIAFDISWINAEDIK